MKKKVTFLMLTLITMITSLAFTSCSKDDEPQSVENYYLVFTSVYTNLGDPTTGESLAQDVYDEFLAASDLDTNGEFAFGKTTEKSALKAFNKSIDNYSKSLNDAYAGKNLLPEGGFIEYNFALKTQSGSTVTNSTIQVTNNGALSY